MKVLLGVDGTTGSLQALERTAERTGATGDDLTVAIAGQSDGDSGSKAGSGSSAGNDAETADHTDLETQVREAIDRRGVDAQVRYLRGGFGSELVELAEAGGFDHLVVGGGERSPMGKIEISHDTQFVLLNARTSVTLVR